MKYYRVIACLLALGLPLTALSQSVLRNGRYTLQVTAEGAVVVQVQGMPPVRLRPEFTVLWSEADPQCRRNPSHPNYMVAPRDAVRWRKPNDPLEALNTWLTSPEMKTATGLSGSVRAEESTGRVWEFRDAQGKVTARVTGEHAFDTPRPFTVGTQVLMRPVRSISERDRVRWEYAPQPEFTLSAELALPAGEADPELSFTLIPRRNAFFSVAYTGAPAVAVKDTLPVSQECEARGHKQFNFVMSEADLLLPRVQVSTVAGNMALVADARECRFRLPSMANTRFGLMLACEQNRLKPVLLAPLLGGPESQMRAGEPYRFIMRCVVRAGNWKETFAHIARDLHGLRDQRDNSGAGSLNGTLERVMDFLADRRGGNHALWDAQQKYYDYYTDKTGVYKPFSPLPGLSAAIVTDDEEFFRLRARPAVEYALSRRTSVFAPYDTADNKQARSFGRALGAPYPGYAQLVSLHELFQRRTPGLLALAQSKGPVPGKISDLLARWQLTGDANVLAEARQAGIKASARKSVIGEDEFFDLLDLATATREPSLIQAAVEAAYQNATKLSLYPVPPDSIVTVDRGGTAPVHLHSIGRHHNIWGFPLPQPVRVPEQTVPAWRIARLGVPALAYPMEYWMNTHGAMLRTAGLAQDIFLRDVARWGMVGRFGNYPGDNRSQDSLVQELPDAVDRRPWDWNFATVNPGHAWDFAGAVLDFLVSDAFERSRGAIDFPALSGAGSNFRVRIYGGKPGWFYGDENVHLWLPRGLVTSDNRQLDWLAGHGNGNLYLALWNQSFREEKAKVILDDTRVQCDSNRDVRVWQNNQLVPPLRVTGNQLSLMIAPKGMVALAIPATVNPRLQGRLLDATSPALGVDSFTSVSTPFGPVHALLLRAGREMTSAFVYMEALPEDVIASRLRWRQGDGAWQEMTDEIYPYEFSPELRDDAGNFSCVLEIENAQQQIVGSSVISLSLNDAKTKTVVKPPAAGPVTPNPLLPLVNDDEAARWLTDEFIAYLQKAANGADFGLRTDSRYYPYSTPQGHRIGWRQAVWNKDLFKEGCTRAEAEQHFRADLHRTFVNLKTALAIRSPSVDFAKLDRRQQETLLDLAFSEGVGGLKSEFIGAVLAKDWSRVVNEHQYVRYAGHAPDHPRNKGFAQRWNIP
jgi:hypothetical protein